LKILFTTLGGIGYQLSVFLGPDQPGKCMAAFFEIRKAPEVRKITALLGLDRLDGTVIALEENALAVRFIHQGQPASIVGQSCESLDELLLGLPFESGQSCDLTFCQAYLAGPPAAGGATLAFIKYRHKQEDSYVGTQRQPRWVAGRPSFELSSTLRLKPQWLRSIQ
jgi:hypothetical protein